MRILFIFIFFTISFSLSAHDLTLPFATADVDLSFFDGLITEITTFFLDLFNAVINSIKYIIDWCIELFKYVFDFDGLIFDLFKSVVNLFKNYIDWVLYAKYFAYINFFMPLHEFITMSSAFLSYAVTFKLIKIIVNIVKFWGGSL